LKQWEETGVWLKAWRALLGALDEKGLLKWDEAFLDGSFAPAKKGAKRSEKPSVVKAQSECYWEMVNLFRWEFGWKVPPRQDLRLRMPRSNRPGVLRRKGRPGQKPKRVIADRGYDSEPLRERWKRRGIELIAPCRKNNKERRYEDGPKLRRYKRRWKIERTNAWLSQFRRVLVRHEHLLTVYRAFFHLACLWITLRKCF